MRNTGAKTRRHILETAYELFYSKGFMRVGIDAVAERAGVTKRTLYYHFDSKDMLLAAVLDLQHALTIERVQRWSSRLGGSAATLIDGIFAALADWAGRPRWSGAGFTRLAMELADLPGHPARAIAKRHKRAIEDWLATELSRRQIVRAKGHAREIALLLEGCMALILIHGERGYAADAARAAKYLILPRPGAGKRPKPSAVNQVSEIAPGDPGSRKIQ